MQNMFLPSDYKAAVLLGRLQTKDGPSPIFIRNGEIFDISEIAPTICHFVEEYGAGFVPSDANKIGDVADFDFAKDGQKLLSPIDLQCIKACGVTFAVSAVERVIEERARGDYKIASEIRAMLSERIGGDIRGVIPGSADAIKLKDALIAEGLWSQYLEVAIGPDAEVFTKAPVLSSVGYGDLVGIRSDSFWNNPEPEIALVVNSKGQAIGATLANDVNLRCFEGRSALLLGKAKDNNASCALGPFIRLFDDGFGIDDVRNAQIDLNIKGEDGFVLNGDSNMSLISRDPLNLVQQTISQHYYPDGFVLLMGTLFAPTQDRDAPSKGFTHKVGDVVAISNEKLGTLVNKVVHCKDAPAWTFGIKEFFKNLIGRGLLK